MDSGWVVDRTNQRGTEVYDREIAGPWPRKLAEEYIRFLKQEHPGMHFVVREKKD